MRLSLLFLLALVVGVALVSFPDIANQALRIEALGWLFETTQGAFIVALLVLMFLFWLLQKIFGGSRSAKRKDKRLRKALAQYLDQRGDLGGRLLKRSRGILPGWVLDMLCTTIIAARDIPLPNENEEPLLTALKARIVTAPHAHPEPDLATRKAHLEAWLNVHPDAPLAMSRMAAIAEKEGDWPKVVGLLESAWKHGHSSSHSLKSRLARGYVAMAKHKPEQATEYLRKAFRLCPEDRCVLVAYGQATAKSGDTKTASRIWNAHLEHHSDYEVATLLLGLAEHDAMRIYRNFENRGVSGLNDAQHWLRAKLAREAGLNEQAFEYMQTLAEQGNSSLAWHTLADWHLAASDQDKAILCYQQALQAEGHS